MHKWDKFKIFIIYIIMYLKISIFYTIWCYSFNFFTLYFERKLPLVKLVWNAYKFVFKKLAHLERWLILVLALSTIILGFAPSVTSFVLKK